MTTGAALPFIADEESMDLLRRTEREFGEPANGPWGLSLAVAQLCLASGAAGHIRYTDEVAAPPKKAHREPRWHVKRRRR